MKESSKNNIVRDIWDFFASMQLSVVIILFLAFTSIFGTLIHQNGNPTHDLQHYGPFLFRFFDTLGLFDLYHAVWYQSAFVILAVNIIVCSIDKLSSTWKIIFKKPSAVPFSRFSRNKDNVNLEFEGDVEPKVREVFKTFSKNIFEEKDGNRTTFTAEKGRKTRLGVYVVHISILFMILGGAIGMYLGFEGFAEIPEGGSIKSVISRDRTQKIDLGFELKCTDFEVTFYDNKMAKEYRSDLVIIKEGKEVLKKSIIVNDPLRYEGFSFYQSSFGESGIPQEMKAVFQSNATGIEYSKKMKFGDVYEIPEGLGTFKLERYGIYNFRGQSLGNAVFGTITRSGEKPIEVAVPLAHPNFDLMRNKMNKGKVLVSFTDISRNYFTGLQVTRDPGVWWVYTGFIMLILGCYITFFMSHKTLCVSIRKSDGKSYVVVAGTANKNKQGMKLWLEKFAGKIEKAIS